MRKAAPPIAMPIIAPVVRTGEEEVVGAKEVVEEEDEVGEEEDEEVGVGEVADVYVDVEDGLWVLGYGLASLATRKGHLTRER
jgi:hypothetical protein